MSEAENKKPKSLDPSWSGSMLQDEPSYNSQIWKSTSQSISRRHFKIEVEAFMLASYDEVEPKLIDEALSISAKEEWKVVMEEEMESMNTNHVLDLVDLPQEWKALGTNGFSKSKKI